MVSDGVAILLHTANYISLVQAMYKPLRVFNGFYFLSQT